MDKKQWDRTMKMLTQANPQDFVSWIFKGAVYTGELNLELQQKPPLFADLLYTLKIGRRKGVLHVEFQRKYHKRMDKRVWQYNCLATIHTGLPVYSIVIYLVKEKKSIVEPPYQMQFPTGVTVHQFTFQNIKMWEVPPEVLKQQNLPGLLPLLPLTKGGGSQEVVEEMIEGLEQAGRTDLLPFGYLFSAYTFSKEDELQWLKERFKKMRDLFEDNVAYREMVQWAEEKALKQGLEQGVKQGLEQGIQALRATLIRFVETHFPDQLAFAKQQVELTTTPLQVQDLLDKLFVARTSDEVRKVLLTLPHA